MAFITTITKQPVKKEKGSDDYLIIIHVEIEDDSVSEIIFSKDYSQRYNSNTVIGNILTGFQDMIQIDWDLYIAVQNIFDSAAFDTMVSQIQTSADTYINS